MSFQEEIKSAVAEATRPMQAEIAGLRKLLEIALSANQAQYLSVDEAAKQLGVSAKTIRRRIQSGEFEVKRIGQKILIPREFIHSI